MKKQKNTLTVKAGDLTRPCRTCAFLGRSRFKKRSAHYGRIVWWCKRGKGYLGSTGTIKSLHAQFCGCSKHQTRAERRVANDIIHRKILSGTETARVLKKKW